MEGMDWSPPTSGIADLNLAGSPPQLQRWWDLAAAAPAESSPQPTRDDDISPPRSRSTSRTPPKAQSAVDVPCIAHCHEEKPAFGDRVCALPGSTHTAGPSPAGMVQIRLQASSPVPTPPAYALRDMQAALPTFMCTPPRPGRTGQSRGPTTAVLGVLPPTSTPDFSAAAEAFAAANTPASQPRTQQPVMLDMLVAEHDEENAPVCANATTETAARDSPPRTAAAATLHPHDHLSRLPDELALRILHAVLDVASPRSLCRMAEVSRHWMALCDDRTLWARIDCGHLRDLVSPVASLRTIYCRARTDHFRRYGNSRPFRPHLQGQMVDQRVGGRRRGLAWLPVNVEGLGAMRHPATPPSAERELERLRAHLSRRRTLPTVLDGSDFRHHSEAEDSDDSLLATPSPTIQPANIARFGGQGNAHSVSSPALRIPSRASAQPITGGVGLARKSKGSTSVAKGSKRWLNHRL